MACNTGAAFVNGKKTNIQNRYDITVRFTNVTGKIAPFVAKEGLVPMYIKKFTTEEGREFYAPATPDGQPKPSSKFYMKAKAIDGDFEIGMSNFCPFHACNGRILHPGTEKCPQWGRMLKTKEIQKV